MYSGNNFNIHSRSKVVCACAAQFFLHTVRETVLPALSLMAMGMAAVAQGVCRRGEMGDDP